MSMVVAGSSKEKEKEIARGAKRGARSSSDSAKIKLFIDDVVQVLGQTPSKKLTSPQTDSQKFRLAFNKSAMV